MTRPLKITFNSESGVTFVELMVVVTIIAIIGSIALMQSGNANIQFKRQNMAQRLKSAFERARFDSVKRRADTTAIQAKVTITPSSFTLRTDRNLDGLLTSADDVVTTLPTGIVIGLRDGSVLTSQDVIFNMRGETPITPSPQFYVCNGSCSSPANGTADLVLVTPTGTVNLLPGSATLPTFGVPTVTNVNTNTGINPDSVLN